MNSAVFRALAAATLLASALLAAAKEPAGGTYTRPWVFLLYGDPSQKVDGTDLLEIGASDKDSIDFKVTVTGSDSATCELSGVAKRKGAIFEYREKAGSECPECMLEFHFGEGGVRLSDGLSCKCYCDQRSSFDGVWFRSPRGETANHGVQRTPKSGAADAER